MGGCGCKEKKMNRVNVDRLVVTCYCGLARLIPEEAQVGSAFRLAPCPACGSSFEGVLVDEHVVEMR